MAFTWEWYHSECPRYYFVWWVWKLYFWNYWHISQGHWVKFEQQIIFSTSWFSARLVLTMICFLNPVTLRNFHKQLSVVNFNLPKVEVSLISVLSFYFVGWITIMFCISRLILWDEHRFDTLKPWQNGCHLADNALIWIHFDLSCMKIVVSYLQFHWHLFPIVQFTIIQHWFRWCLAGNRPVTSHYLNQWWHSYWCLYASLPPVSWLMQYNKCSLICDKRKSWDLASCAGNWNWHVGPLTFQIES